MQTGSIFIHASFRTGSTLLWSRLQSSDIFAFFEPLHEFLAQYSGKQIVAPAVSLTASLRDRSVENLFEAYDELVGSFGGVALYRASFSADRYFAPPEERHDALKAYVASLTAHAQARGKRAVMKFVRTQGRVGWMKRNFEGQHISLVRNPFHQFCSYIWNARHGNWYFLGFSCLVMHRNCFATSALLSHLIEFVPTSGTTFEQQLLFERVARQLNIYQLYFVFFYIWKRSCLSALAFSDDVIDLLGDPAAGERLGRLLEIGPIKADPTNSQSELTDNDRFRRVEALVRLCLREEGVYRSYERKWEAKDLSPWLLAEMNVDQAVPGVGDNLYTRNELWASLGGKIRLGETDQIGSLSAFGLQADVPRSLHAERTIRDKTGVSVGARNLMIADQAALTYDAFLDEHAISFNLYAEGLVFVGMHEALRPGRYTLNLDVEIMSRPDAIESEFPRFAFDILGVHDDLLIHPMTGLGVEERSLRSLTFEVPEGCADIHVRGWAFRSRGRVFGYRLDQCPE